jgi:hypothetical protein
MDQESSGLKETESQNKERDQFDLSLLENLTGMEKELITKELNIHPHEISRMTMDVLRKKMLLYLEEISKDYDLLS